MKSFFKERSDSKGFLARDGCSLVAAFIAFWCFFSIYLQPVHGGKVKAYVGTENCRQCHEEQYNGHMANSSKAKSYDNVKMMKKGLTDAEYKDCLKCHTTGYGEPGGFVSIEATPDLKNPGCESCHGPGSIHAETGDPGDLDKVSLSSCVKCHTSDRVKSFKFKPMLYKGGH